MHVRFLKRLTGAGLLVLAVALACIGCGGLEDANPLNPGDPSITAGADDVDSGILMRANGKQAKPEKTAPPSRTMSRSQVIRPDAPASIQIKTDDGAFRYRLTFKAGSVDRPTKITMTVPDPTRSMVILEPHGIRFNRPVALRMEIFTHKVANLDPAPHKKNKLDIYWFNEYTGEWEGQGAQSIIDFKGKKIRSTVDLDHFSRYALGGDSPIQKMYYQYGWGYYD